MKNRIQCTVCCVCVSEYIEYIWFVFVIIDRGSVFDTYNSSRGARKTFFGGNFVRVFRAAPVLIARVAHCCVFSIPFFLSLFSVNSKFTIEWIVFCWFAVIALWFRQCQNILTARFECLTHPKKLDLSGRISHIIKLNNSCLFPCFFFWTSS